MYISSCFCPLQRAVNLARIHTHPSDERCFVYFEMYTVLTVIVK